VTRIDIDIVLDHAMRMVVLRTSFFGLQNWAEMLDADNTPDVRGARTGPRGLAARTLVVDPRSLVRTPRFRAQCGA